MNEFTRKRGPFTRCSKCLQITMRILSAERKFLINRRTNCRATVKVPLPELNKKAIYLDQFMFSMIYNVENERNLHKGHEAFAKEVYELLRRCVLLQQVFLPHSDIHRDETTLFRNPVDLRSSYEFFGGGISLVDSHDIKLSQDIQFAMAYFDGAEPTVALNIDEITNSQRNEWLPDRHVDMRIDYSQFADHIRTLRSEVHDELKQLAEIWFEKKATFADVLENEFLAIGPTKMQTLTRSLEEVSNSDPSDPAALFESSNKPIYRECRELCHLLEDRGVDKDQQVIEIMNFWNWDRQREIPHERISAYLFAAVARRVVAGEKKIIDQGLINDVRTISTYAPYMDALFIDKKCAALLKAEPLKTNLEYKARVFSLNDTDEFVEYLREIEGQTPDDVHEHASRIYGID